MTHHGRHGGKMTYHVSLARPEHYKTRIFFIDIIGADWLTNRVKHQSYDAHPIIQRWTGKGAGHYLELNGLAEDLRLLHFKPGFEHVLKDLKESQLCFSTWHMVHSAALFERANPGTVQLFFPQASESVPDFLLRFQSFDIPVEAKLLTKSDKEALFESWSAEIQRELFEKVLLENEFLPIVSLVVKSFDNVPNVQEIIEAVSTSLHAYSGIPLKASFAKCNVIVEPTTITPDTLSTHRALYIFCPRHPREDIRIEGRSKDASRQLRLHTTNENEAGLFSLGIGRLQNPHYISELLLRRFARSQYSNISLVLLLRTGTFMEPPKRSIIDFVETVTNVNSRSQMPGNLQLKSLGLSARLVTGVPPEPGIPAYRNMRAEGRIQK